MGLIEKPSKSLQIRIGQTCNNFCIFCFDDRTRRFKEISQVTIKEVKKMLDEGRNKKFKKVVFTCGEPTLRLPLLFKSIDLAREKDYKIISLVTNGRMLSYKSLAETILRKGVNEIILSIHGHNSALHDSLTRTPGSFLQTTQGLKHLSELRKRYCFRFLTSTVINKLNFKSMREITKFLQSYNIDSIIFNFIMIPDKADKFFDALVPSYAEVIKGFNKLPHNSQEPILEDLPFCLADKIKGRWSPRERICIAKNKQLEFDRVSKNRIKMNKCNKCKYYVACDGVSKKYLDLYGEKEFSPITK